MKILAFDQSSRTTGYAFFENSKLTHYNHFTFSDTDFGIRLHKIRQKLIDLIKQYQPDKVVFEDIQLQDNVGNNVDTFKKLAEVYGVFLETLTELNISYETVLASSWKKTLNISGKNREIQKKNAALWVQTNYNVQPQQDTCDAICIGAHSLLKEQSFDWAD